MMQRSPSRVVLRTMISRFPSRVLIALGISTHVLGFDYVVIGGGAGYDHGTAPERSG
jgi:hypothetical protein